jgi:hypothetical protein
MYRRQLFTAAGAMLATFATGAAVAQPAPPAVIPPLRAEPPPPPPPDRRYVWEAGHWHWDGVGWEWHPGRYVLRRVGWHEYVPGEWVLRHGGWVWVPAHWR